MKGKIFSILQIFHVRQSPCRHEIFSNIDSKAKREVKRDTSWRLEITKSAEISSSPDCKKPMKPIVKVEKVTQKSKYWRKPETPKEISKENLLERLDSIEVETEEESAETARWVNKKNIYIRNIKALELHLFC